jgi:GNAT superfamily N-acetyltransferase
MAQSPVRVDPVEGWRDRHRFCELPYMVYRDDPHWVAPLRSVERERWSPEHNASLRTRWTRRFLARREGRVVGRIAVAVDEAFAARWMPGAGFFGFFECLDDPEVARALLGTAEQALRERGRSVVLGPINLSTHDEVGLLVDGFGLRPTVLSPYNPPYYPALLEANGYRRCREYHAYRWQPDSSHGATISRLERAAGRRAGMFGQIRLRPADPERWDEEVRALREVYNASFADLWGFVPVSPAEFAQRAASFRPFFRPELLVIAEADERMVGFALVLPDVNEVLARLRGRLLPFGWIRLLGGMPRIRSVRFILIGVLPEFASRGLAPVLAARVQEVGRSIGLRSGEISLVAGPNQRMQRVIEAFALPRIKTFRLYSKELSGESPAAP